MYFVEKKGMYGHGIFWIGEDLEEAKKMADHFAENDRDDHHSYDVFKFQDQKSSKMDAYHEDVYSVSKGNQINKYK